MNGSRAITLVASREIRERLRSPAFLASTLVLLLLVGASTALNGALSDKTTYRVAVISPVPPGLGAALQRTAEPFNAKVQLRVSVRRAAGREALTASMSMRSYSWATTGSSSAQTSTRNSPLSQTRPCGPCGATCRLRPS